ncbi:Fic family protein [Asticcacaulis sp. W401b]|uniref:Fic family protein n=1 Tax=Asticcacaulis sp. W401b TaxID=3388666 RepID=UPI003970C621
MTKPPLPWQAHTAKDYDANMSAQCGQLLIEIVADRRRRQAILADPRELHKELFAPFTPAGHLEYAGTYRGTADTTVFDRRMIAASQLKPGTEYEFCPPQEVAPQMTKLLGTCQNLLKDTNADDYGRLIVLTYGFCWFGKIHPFLDGNGHVQRALFAAMATEYGYSLSPRFALHPRPYDRLLATALEIFTRAPTGTEDEELGLVAEYLAFFLGEPFNVPRKNVATPSPYTP